LVTVRIQVHAHLTIIIRFPMIGGDNKSLQADQFLLAEQRCACCTLKNTQWGTDINVARLTVGGRVCLHVDAVDSLYSYILDGTVKNWGAVTKAGTILWAWRKLKEHSGCSSFPTQTHGNADAHILIMRHLATRMNITDTVGDWTETDRKHIFHRYASLMVLDNQLNSTTRIYPIVPGYPIDEIVCKVPTLHGVLRWFKSIIIDIVLNTVEGGVKRDAFSAKLLGVISPNQSWFNFFYAWMLRFIISNESAWEGAPRHAKKLRVLMYSFVATCRLRDHTPVRLVKLAVACQLLHAFTQSLSDRVFAPSGVTAVSGKHAGKDLTDKKTLWRHFLCAHLLPELMSALSRNEGRASEEGLEFFVGELQRIFRTRAVNASTDHVRVHSIHSTKQQYKARYGRSRDRQVFLPYDPAERGTILMPTLSAIRGSVVALLQFVTDQGWGEFIHYRGDVVFLSSEPPGDRSWQTLQDCYDVLCGCSADALCECHASSHSHPAESSSRPHWLL
jgi:hypothetical protein